MCTTKIPFVVVPQVLGPFFSWQACRRGRRAWAHFDAVDIAVDITVASCCSALTNSDNYFHSVWQVHLKTIIKESRVEQSIKRKIFRRKKLSFLYVLPNLEHNSRQQNAIKGNFNPNLCVVITYFKPVWLRTSLRMSLKPNSTDLT